MTTRLMLALLCLPTLAFAQTNFCDPTAPPQTLPYSATEPLNIWFTSPSQTQTNVDMSTYVVDYLGEILVAGTTTPVTNWTIPKTDLVPTPGTPANCYTVRLPAFKTLLQTNFYTIRITARGQGGTMPAISPVSSDRFFLPGVPVAPGVPRLRP